MKLPRHRWLIAESHTTIEYRLVELPNGEPMRFTGYFIDKPANRAHAIARGLPHGHRYAVYLAGAHPSGCAALMTTTRTLGQSKTATLEMWRVDLGLEEPEQRALPGLG